MIVDRANQRVGSSSSFEERFEQEEKGLLLERLRFVICIAFVVWPAYYFLDRVMAPEHSEVFLNIRIFVFGLHAFIFAATYSRLGQRFLLPISMLTILSMDAAIAVMTTYMGGFRSDYYVGDMLVLSVSALFLPWSLLETLVFGVMFIGVYVGINLWCFGPSKAMISPCFFLSGTAIVGAMSELAGKQSRRRDLGQKISIEEARDKLKALDEAKTRFFSNVSHELRTPLTVLLGPLESAIAGGQAPSGPTLKAMATHARRLLRHVNMILDFAKADSGHMTIQIARGNIGTLLAEVAAAARIQAERKGIRLRTEGISGVADSHFDVDKMETLVANLVSNALKFTPRGGEINIRASTEDESIRIEVSDTGIGIAEDQLEHVFERFHQVEDTQTRSAEGTGLGLAMVREIAELHRGRAWATSRPGSGSTFYVALPPLSVADPGPAPARGTRELRPLDIMLADTDDSRTIGDRGEEKALDLVNEQVFDSTDSRDSRESGQDHEPPSVLLAEDNPDLRAYVHGLLQGRYRVYQAVNGRHAYELAIRYRPDLILSDAMMPEMSGGELCRRVRAHPDLKSTPFVMLTARLAVESKLTALEEGANDYLTKPFVPRELLARVENLIALHQRNREIQVLRSNQLEQAKLSALGEMAGGVAHEINNPLAIIKLATEQIEDLALEQPLDATALSQRVNTVRQTVARIARIVQGLRFFSRDASHDPTQVELTETIISNTLALCQESFKTQGVRVSLSSDNPANAIRCRPVEVSQILLNLINNSRDAISSLEDKWIEIAVRTQDDRLVIAVTDSGPGIPPDLQPKVFQPFFTTKGIGKGTGLGLSVSAGLARSNNGSLRYDAESKNTRFVLEFPRVAQSPVLAKTAP